VGQSISASTCGICGEGCPLPVGLNSDLDRTSARCRICRLAPPPFERAVAYGSYDGPLRDLVHLLKFDLVRPAVPVLGRMLADSITSLCGSLPAGVILVVPVPLHRRKQAQRGFNQAGTIARAALKQLSHRDRSQNRFELCERALVRRRDTSSQIGLTRHQRRQNLRGAFAVGDATLIAKRDILLVDDVYTTGTTASECARVLRRAGAARVWVATVARTLKLYGLNASPQVMEQSQEVVERGHEVAS